MRILRKNILLTMLSVFGNLFPERGYSYMSISATELKANLGKYLLLAMTEDILITQYGKVVAKLTRPFQDRMEIAESLFGVLPQTSTWEETREERLIEA